MMRKLPYTITGVVVHGNSLGNTINVPTANIIPREDISGYDKGVYRSRVRVEEKEYDSITNLGTKPTVSDTECVNAESFIKDFHGYLYNREISVTLLEFVRPERKFASFEELTEQIRKDIEENLG